MLLGNKDGTFAGGPIANADFASSTVGDFDGDGNLILLLQKLQRGSGLPRQGWSIFTWEMDGTGNSPASTKVVFSSGYYYSFAINDAATTADFKPGRTSRRCAGFFFLCRSHSTARQRSR
jgi:hypothetical protein